MKKVLFVCHGNICRSPMAEFVMKHLLSEAGLLEGFEIASAATSNDSIGNPVYPPARETLGRHSIYCSGKTARCIRRRDYDDYDLLIGMDDANIRDMRSTFGGDPDGKISRLMDYTERPGQVADPWYTRDFDRTWDDVLCGCRALLRQLQTQ